MRHLLSIADLDRPDIDEILALAAAADSGRPLDGQGVALIFQKPSARTRNSMEMAVVQLGGHPVYIAPGEVGLDERETVEDVARSLAGYHSILAARVAGHDHLERMKVAGRPVLNLLSDSDHPLQALADILTMKYLLGNLEGVRIAYVGDPNNVCRSLAQACRLHGADFVLAAPDGYRLTGRDAEGIGQTSDPVEAVKGARIVYTDVWVSMGQDEEAAKRRRDFAPYRVDSGLMARSDDAWFMHCLPARRGEEVDAEVLDGARSAVWRQAENRMHSARGALAWIARA